MVFIFWKQLIFEFIIENMLNEIQLYSEENHQLKSNFISDIKKIQKKQADDLFFLEIKSREIMQIQVMVSFLIYIYISTRITILKIYQCK